MDINPAKKRVAISAGPIPAKLDPVKFVTNRFKGGLALKTAAYLASQPDFEVTLVMWKNAVADGIPSGIKKLATVEDVFEYYDWFAANAKNYDAFVMAAAVANLTPVHPYEQKFPSHLYKPGEEFDIKFMIAPRAIDAIKQLNPRACLIGYKLYDEPDDGKLADIARHTLADTKANVIFANHPETAKNKKIAVTADGSAIPMDFNQHLEFMAKAIRQTYFITEIEPLSESEQADPDIREALATVKMYEQTFDKYGTVAVPVANHDKMFATTSRGHKSGPVIVRNVDGAAGYVTASGKATLNAPALGKLLERADFQGIVIHRHYGDPNADPKLVRRYENRYADCRPDPSLYVFPGTIDEYDRAKNVACTQAVAWFQPYHGYLSFKPFESVDWERYGELFPERYFRPQAEMLDIVKHFRDRGLDVLEIGGNRHPAGNLSYDPYVEPDPGSARRVTEKDIAGRVFPLAVCFNSVNYLSRAEIADFIAHSGAFMANTFRQAPEEKATSEEYAVLDRRHGEAMVRHGLRLPGDGLMRHRFHAYNKLDFEGLGLACWEYGTNSMVAYRNLSVDMGRSALTEHAAETGIRKEGHAMLHIVNAYRQDEPSLILRVKSDLPSSSLEQAARDAVKDFLENGGLEADNALSATCGNFDWGGLALWLPERFAKAHGFEILDASVADLTVRHGESLLPENTR